MKCKSKKSSYICVRVEINPSPLITFLGLLEVDIEMLKLVRSEISDFED